MRSAKLIISNPLLLAACRVAVAICVAMEQQQLTLWAEFGEANATLCKAAVDETR